MIIEYSLDVGKYLHEVMVEAELDDIIYYMAAKDLRLQEEESARRRAAARAQARR